MKKALICIGYIGAAFVFASFIYAGIITPLWHWSDPWFTQWVLPVMLGVCGFGAFFLKKPYRMPAVLFIFWSLWFLLAFHCYPLEISFHPSTWSRAFDAVKNRNDFLSALFFSLWCLFGMAQVFIKQPPRDKIIIIHSTLSVLIYGIWRLFFRQVL